MTNEFITAVLPSLFAFCGAMIAVKTEIKWLKSTQDKLDKRVTTLENKAAI